MMKIILARHGETEWNVEEVFRGTIDVELNETGLKQAELLGEYLRDEKIEAIYSSPLKRALNTAEAIARHQKLDVEVSQGLIDLNFGEWQGLSSKEVKEKYQEQYAKWLNHPDRLQFPGGETLKDVRQRALGLVNKVIAEYEGTVVLAAHRVVNKVLICALLGLDNSHFWNIRQDTCGITTFSHHQGRFILVEHNNTSYLRPLQKAPLSDF